MTNKGQKPIRRVRKMAFFKIQTQILKALIFLIWEMALFLNFGLNWAKQDFLEKRSKSTQKMRKFKSCRWHPIFVSHMKFCKKVIFNGSQHWKWHGNGQKMAEKDQKPFQRHQKVPFFTIWAQILKALIFLMWKMAFFFNFGRFLSKRIFLALKNTFWAF